MTVPDTYAESHITNTAAKSGTAAHKAAQNQVEKYTRLANSHIFYPVATETAGTWHDMAGDRADTGDWQAQCCQK